MKKGKKAIWGKFVFRIGSTGPKLRLFNFFIAWKREEKEKESNESIAKCEAEAEAEAEDGPITIQVAPAKKIRLPQSVSALTLLILL